MLHIKIGWINMYHVRAARKNKGLPKPKSYHTNMKIFESSHSNIHIDLIR